MISASNEEQLEVRNPSLWRCIVAQKIPGTSVQQENPWWGQTYFHQTPCRCPLPFAPDAPNLIIWNGSLHQAALAFKPDVMPVESSATVSYFG